MKRTSGNRLAASGEARVVDMGTGDDARRRSIRSFVIRAGRMTAAQRRAVDELGERYLVQFNGDFLDLDRLFGRPAPRTVEVGFGAGDALTALADSEPARDFLGIEVYPPGVGRLLARCHEAGLGNVRVAMADALDVLERWLAPSSVEEVLVWFPDPWPKKRHHKRRLVQSRFVSLVHRVLQPGGWLHLATDWEPYADHMLKVLEAHPGFSNCAAPDRFMPRPERRRETRFERRGRGRGHRVFDLVWRAVPSDAPE
ncbi:MAG: tRNA (guanosine(46)-N7)-methyltransferase TrmB [Chromatiales bacterium]|nr:tRNA (guanosine(46)-N7)-methyltransferase TrmB [Chromatiales bacterium]